MSSYTLLAIVGLLFIVLVVVMNYFLVSRLYNDEEKTVTRNEPYDPAVSESAPQIFDPAVKEKVLTQDVPKMVRLSKRTTSDLRYRQTLKQISQPTVTTGEAPVKNHKADTQYRQALSSLSESKKKQT